MISDFNLFEIDDVNCPELDIYNKLRENQLAHFYEPEPGLFITESPKVINRALAAGYKPESFIVASEFLHDKTYSEILQAYSDVPIYTAKGALLEKLTGYALTNGLLCAMRRKKLPSLYDICKGAKRIAVMENVVNPTNVGAIFRSAAALYMDAVILTASCSDPLYRRASRVSMGTVFQAPWTILKENELWQGGIKQLNDLGFKTAAMALKPNSYNIDSKELSNCDKLAVILGAEGDGLSTKTIAACDYTVCIPMSHNVDSLNVAAASAVAFWQLGKKH